MAINVEEDSFELGLSAGCAFDFRTFSSLARFVLISIPLPVIPAGIAPSLPKSKSELSPFPCDRRFYGAMRVSRQPSRHGTISRPSRT